MFHWILLNKFKNFLLKSLKICAFFIIFVIFWRFFEFFSIFWGPRPDSGFLADFGPFWVILGHFRSILGHFRGFPKISLLSGFLAKKVLYGADLDFGRNLFLVLSHWITHYLVRPFLGKNDVFWQFWKFLKFFSRFFRFLAFLGVFEGFWRFFMFL